MPSGSTLVGTVEGPSGHLVQVATNGPGHLKTLFIAAWPGWQAGQRVLLRYNVGFRGSFGLWGYAGPAPDPRWTAAMQAALDALRAMPEADLDLVVGELLASCPRVVRDHAKAQLEG